MVMADGEERGSARKQSMRQHQVMSVVFLEGRLGPGTAGGRLELGQRAGKSWVVLVKETFVSQYFKGQGRDATLPKDSCKELG